MTKRNVRRTKEQWAEIVAQYHSSGMDAKAFCEDKQITLVTFNKWRLRHAHPSPSLLDSQRPAFTPVTRIESTDQSLSSVRMQIGRSITVSISVDGAVHDQ